MPRTLSIAPDEWSRVESTPAGDSFQVTLPASAGGEVDYFEADAPTDALRVSLDGEVIWPAEGEYALNRWRLPEAPGSRSLVIVVRQRTLPPSAAGLRSHGFAAFGLTALHQHLSLDRSEAALSLVCDIEADRHARVTLESRITLEGFPVTEASDGFHVRCGETGVVQSLIVPRAQLWWPAGHGRRPLYRLHCRLLSEDGGVLDEWECMFGLREVTAEGGLRLNGSPILLRGWYWRAGPRAGEAPLLTRLKASGCNFLRVFTGIESREFYEECGRLGLLVCQELPDAPAPGAAELDRVIRSRRGHAALALWGAAEADSAVAEAFQDAVAAEDPEAAWWPMPSDVRPLLTDAPPDEWRTAQELRLWAEGCRSRSEPAVMPADVRALTWPVIRSAGSAFAPFHVSLHPDEAPPAGVRRSVQVRLHNDGRALELLNVTVRVVDLAGADVHQENLAAEAEAVATTCLGEVEWRVTPQRPGPFLVLAEVIDEEGVTLAESDLLLGAEACPAVSPATSVALELEGEYVRAVNRGRAPALWVRVNADDPAREVVTGFSLGPGSARTVAAGSLAGLTVDWLNRA